MSLSPDSPLMSELEPNLCLRGHCVAEEAMWKMEAKNQEGTPAPIFKEKV